MNRHGIFAVLGTGWMLTQLFAFRRYWHDASTNDTAAIHMLASDLCKSHEKRVSVRHLSRCEEAEQIRSIGPLQRALFLIGEDWSMCGHNRCTVLYTDITERFTQFILVFIFGLLIILVKTCRDYKRASLESELNMMTMPMDRRFLKLQ